MRSLEDETHASTEGALVPLIFIGRGAAPAASACLSLRHSASCVCSGKHCFRKARRQRPGRDSCIQRVRGRLRPWLAPGVGTEGREDE